MTFLGTFEWEFHRFRGVDRVIRRDIGVIYLSVRVTLFVEPLASILDLCVLQRKRTWNPKSLKPCGT